MMFVTPVFMLNLTLMGGLWPFGGGDDVVDPGNTIKSLEQKELQLKATPEVVDGATLAREQYREFLKLTIDNPELRNEAMRRLADLNLVAGENAQFSGIDAEGELFYRQSITLYESLLASNAEYRDTDLILYQLARAYEVVGDEAQALVTLDRLVADHPTSQYFDEAQFRRGEILFVDKAYSRAESSYEAVVAIGSSSSFYEQALYKHGWAQFKQGRHDESLNSFMDLLDLRLGQVDPDDANGALGQMSRAERELMDDTLRVLSLSFSYLDGVDSIDRLLQQRGTMNYADLLYANLGNLYLEKERYIDAAAAYTGFINQQPTHGRSPALQVQVIEAYTLGKFPSLVLEAKQDYVELYGLHSEFWNTRSTADQPEVVAFLKENLSDLAAYDHARAQAEDDDQAYERAARWYRRYLEYFPEDPDSAGRSLLLAEIYDELERYDAATSQYLDAAYNYGPHDKAAEAAYAALLSARQHELALTGPDKDSWHSQSIDNSLRFAKSFPDHPQAAPVLTKVAEELFAAGELDRSVQIAGLVVTLQPPAEMALERTAWNVIAHANFDLERYAAAEAAYLRLRDLPTVDLKGAKEIEERIAASVYRQAEQAQIAGNQAMAVTQFLRVADAAPDSEIVPNAIYDAGTSLITAGQWSEAVIVLQRFRNEFPNHRFNDDVTQKLAVAYEEAAQPVPAAMEYERIAVLTSVNSEVRREALWKAASLYEQVDQPSGQQRVYNDIVTRFPEPMAESIEARQHLADLAKAAGDYSGRRHWLKSIVKVDSAAGEARNQRSRTLAASASLELAEPLREAFAAVRLTIPLEDSLKLKKKRMELALDAYGRTVEYGVAGVSTAATFEIAELYYRLSQDLMNSERPSSLSEEELEQYEILLEEQAFPFEEQAIEIYGANAKRASEGVFDASVQKSFARLASLMPARYAKTERSEIVSAHLN